MKISFFTVNDFDDPEPVIATVYCRRIVIGESAAVEGWPTTDYEIKGDEAGSEFMRKLGGTSFPFELLFLGQQFEPGQIVGYVQTISGTTTFYKKEDS